MARTSASAGPTPRASDDIVRPAYTPALPPEVVPAAKKCQHQNMRRGPGPEAVWIQVSGLQFDWVVAAGLDVGATEAAPEFAASGSAALASFLA